jgi:iron complex outermembrane receptor protein
MDWESGDADRFTVQGDVYSGDKDGEFLGDFTLGTLPSGLVRGTVDLSGANVLARWARRVSETSSLALKLYYDRTERDIPNTYDENRETLDVDFQHRFSLSQRNDIVWGAGWRTTSDELENSNFSAFVPRRRTDTTLNVFLQDEIELMAERLFLTVGAKVEENDYSGRETQPNLRLTWLIDERRTFWSSVSRAVRIPSRLDTDLVLTLPFDVPAFPVPVYVQAIGNDDFLAEKLLAYEAGYRAQVGDYLSFDVNIFRNVYDRLQTTEPLAPVIVLDPPTPYAILPRSIENSMAGESAGAGFSATWLLRPKLRMRFQYSYIDFDLHLDPLSEDPAALAIAGNSPEHQASLHAFAEITDRVTLYGGVRRVGELEGQGVDEYTAVDLNIDWTATPTVHTSLTIRNLTDEGHFEFRDGGGSLIGRTALVRADWRF